MAHRDVGQQPRVAAVFGQAELVLGVVRKGQLIKVNEPEADALEAGDRLLCFGKLEEMRSMVAPKRRRRAKVKKLPKQQEPGA